MKWNNIFHALGVISCILGTITLYNSGEKVWNWPLIAMVWILSSYINALTGHHWKKQMDEMDKERHRLINDLHKADMRAWEAELKLAKSDKK